MRRILAGFLLAASLSAQYAPIERPAEWTFIQPTAAYSPADPGEKIGDFQPGITVEVVDEDPGTGRWQVVFKRIGQPNVVSLIDPPDLAEARPAQFARVAKAIAGFPALEKMLEAPTPWPASPGELARRLFPAESGYLLQRGTLQDPEVLQAPDHGKATAVWGLQPLTASVDYSQADNPMVRFELWNKGDAHKTELRPSKARRLIRERLERIQREFPTRRDDPGRDNPVAGITAIRLNESVYLLPNDLRISLRYDHDEYLLLQIQSIARLESGRGKGYDPEQFERMLAAKLRTSEPGHRYIAGIPMVSQGEKGYCAAATLARVLQHYGFFVDQHALADLAETEGQWTPDSLGGTFHDDIIDAMRRITNSTPFRLRQLRKADPGAIREIIEQGVPIIWFVPGHVRLLIGIHPRNNQIVFSDTWGLEHAYKIGTWQDFMQINEEMWYLEHHPK